MKLKAVLLTVLLAVALVATAQTATPPPMPPHGVTLGFTGVTGVTGYVVWRGTTTGGPYTPIAVLNAGTLNCPLSTCQWTDPNVVSGSTYYYVLTSYLTTGTSTLQSVYSAEVSGTIPADATPPASVAKPVATPK